MRDGEDLHTVIDVAGPARRARHDRAGAEPRRRAAGRDPRRHAARRDDHAALRAGCRRCSAAARATCTCTSTSSSRAGSAASSATCSSSSPTRSTTATCAATRACSPSSSARSRDERSPARSARGSGSRRERGAEIALAELLELSPGGLEEREPGDGAVEYAIYGAPGELPALPDLRAAAGDALSTSRATRGRRRLGASAGRRSTGRSRCAAGARRLRVRPPWEPALADDAIEIVIDPGQAFGDRRPPDDAAVPGAAARARAGGRARRLGLRQRRARDRRGAARLGPGARRATTSRRRSTRRARTPRPTALPRIAIERIDLRRGAGAVGADRRARTSCARCCSTSRRR